MLLTYLSMKKSAVPLILCDILISKNINYRKKECHHKLLLQLLLGDILCVEFKKKNVIYSVSFVFDA
jgi:hypothetical protein